MPSMAEWWRGGKEESEKNADIFDTAASSERRCSSGSDRRQQHQQHVARMRSVMVNQTLLAQFFKLVVLFVIALVHVFYARDFLAVFRTLEEFVETARARAARPEHVVHATFLLNLLVDYKKNLWISVSAMCACLSASCFFLLLLREEAYRPFYLFVMRLVDGVVFLALPALLWARSRLVEALLAHADEGLAEAAKSASPVAMMNKLHCSVVPREQVPLCSSVLERTIFPLVVLEYLVVLCMITAAYVGLAYLIVYCIKHWFPHAQPPVLPIYRSPSRYSAAVHSSGGKPSPYGFRSGDPAGSRPLLHTYSPLAAEQLA